MKNAWLWIVIVVVVLGGGYFYRHQIKAMLMGSSATPATSTNLYGAPSAQATPAATGDVVSWQSGTNGQYAVAANGMTLYSFDRDTKGVSNCSGSCAGVWPPYMATTVPSTLPTGVTVITRADGSKQFAYKGMPLYYYTGDAKVGDVTGDGFNGVWHLVKP